MSSETLAQAGASVPAQPAWRLILALACINAVGNAASIAAPLWVESAPEALGLPDWAGGAIASAQLFAAAGANIATSALQRRLRPRLTARLALALAVVAHLLAIVPNAWVFAASLIAAGGTLGALSAIVLGAASRFPDPHRVFAAFTGVLTIYASLFYVVAPEIIAPAGMAGLFGLLALLCALVLPATASLDPGPPEGALPEAPAAPLANRAAGPIGLLALALLMAGHVGTVSYAVPFGAAFGFSAEATGLVLAVASLVSVGGALLAGALGERRGRLVPSAVGMGLMAASVALLPRTSPAAAFPVSMVLFYTSTMFTIPYLMSLLASLDGLGRWIAMGPSAIMVGSAVGPGIAAGLLALGWGTPAIAFSAIALIALSFLVLLIAARQVSANGRRPAG